MSTLYVSGQFVGLKPFAHRVTTRAVVAGDSQDVVTEGERIDDRDWLGNQTSCDDDASSFDERSLGAVTNGRDEEGDTRPSALYFATNIDSVAGIESGWDGAGWVEVAYGDSGNVTSFTVHGECDDTTTNSCTDSPSSSASSRASTLAAGCTCAVEQHYSYRWDELNRLVDARRYDRTGGTGDWTYQTRMRYRYDGANQRTVEESFAYGAQNTSHRIALTVYPGHFERRGLVRGSGTYDAQGTTTDTDATETQYMIGGARIVWDAEPDTMGGEFDRNRRATIRATNLLGTTGAVLDIESRELLEVSTYYPSGARENLWTDDAAAPLEPIGFTGKEADEEIGAVYFGERWLIPRLGRWATPDPLHVHASGGGEALNSYHYVSGNLLQATDPTGLDLFGRAASDREAPDAERASYNPDDPNDVAAARAVHQAIGQSLFDYNVGLAEAARERGDYDAYDQLMNRAFAERDAVQLDERTGRITFATTSTPGGPSVALERLRLVADATESHCYVSISNDLPWRDEGVTDSGDDWRNRFVVIRASLQQSHRSARVLHEVGTHAARHAAYAERGGRGGAPDAQHGAERHSGPGGPENAADLEADHWDAVVYRGFDLLPGHGPPYHQPSPERFSPHSEGTGHRSERAAMEMSVERLETRRGRP